MPSLDARIRAERASQLLGDEVLAEALDAIETGAVDALASADLADALALQRHAAALQAARALRDELRSIVTRGAPGREPPAVA